MSYRPSSGSSTRSAGLRDLPPNVYQTLANLQRTVHQVSAVRRSTSSSSDEDGELYHRRRGGVPSNGDASQRHRGRHGGSNDDGSRPSSAAKAYEDRMQRISGSVTLPVGTPAVAAKSTADASRRRLDAYEVDSVEGKADLHIRKPEATKTTTKQQRRSFTGVELEAAPRSGASLNDSASERPYASRAVVDVSSSSYQSTLGRRWGNTFEDMERALTAPVDVLPRDSNPSERYPAAAAAPPSTSAAAHSTTSGLHEYAHREENFHAAAAQVASLEMDALRRQSSELAALKIEVKELVSNHKEEIAALRVQHTQELQKMADSMREAKERLVDDAYNRQLIMFRAKEDLLKAEADAAQRRLKEAEGELDGERSKTSSVTNELRMTVEQIETLRKEVARLQFDGDRSASDVAILKKEKVDLQMVVQDREGDLRAAKHKEALLADEQHKLQNKIGQLEESLRMQDLQAKEHLRKLEKEFSENLLQFELLLNEMTEKSQRHEKLKQKYKQLKDSAASRERELQAALSQSAAIVKELKDELQEKDEACRVARADVCRKEHELREERSSHQQLVEELQLRLDSQKSMYDDSLTQKQRELQGFEKSILRVQQDRNDLHQKLRLREQELDAKAEVVASLTEELSRTKASFASDSEMCAQHHKEAMEALKRQLVEKDRRLEQLAAAGAEPLQRLRKQLDDERSKRVALQQQLEYNQRLAKEAEENVKRELRREQLKHPHVTTAAATSAATPARAAQTIATQDNSSLATAESVTTNATVSTQAGAVTVTRTSSAPQALPPLCPSMIPTPMEAVHRVEKVATKKIDDDRRRSVGDAAFDEHEAKMEEFKSASDDVFHRIINSQKKLWERCQEVVSKRGGPLRGDSPTRDEQGLRGADGSTESD